MRAFSSHSPWLHRRLLLLLGFSLVIILVACSGDEDDDDFDNGEAQATQAQSEDDDSSDDPGGDMTSTPITTTVIPTPGGGRGVIRRAPGDEPQLVNPVDVVFNDLTNDRAAFEIDAEPRYGDNPQAFFEPLVDGIDFEGNIRSNLRWLVDQGYDTVYLDVMDGYGAVLVPSQVLAGLRHPGFDYDAQYDGPPEEDRLNVDEDDARQRYFIAGDVFPFVANEAHALDLTVEVNVEAIAHIINRALGEGIGASEDSVDLAGHLPPPTIDELLAFLDEVIASGADRIFAEALPRDYDLAVAKHLEQRGIPYLHTGAELGSVWVGYYYSLYPDRPEVATAYAYQYTDDALLGLTNAAIFARARGEANPPATAVVVGAYNPVPCDTSLSIADLYSDDRPGDAFLIDNEFPVLADGTSVANCATDMWLNLLLVAARRQGVDVLRLTSDIEPSINATRQPGLGSAIQDRLAAHPAVAEDLPIANIILDVPTFGPDDGFLNEEFIEIVSLSTLGLVDDALSAAGYLTVLTLDQPWTGGDVALTYIVTAGGNEDTQDGIGMGPPFWTDAQGLQPELLALLDPTAHAGPVFIHPLLGLPDSGNWSIVRSQFGLPARFGFRNPSLSEFEEYHTSLLTSIPVDSQGETPENVPSQAITPASGTVLGQSVFLAPFIPVPGAGQVANYIGPEDVSISNVFASGPLILPDASSSTAPYLLSDGAGRFLWVLNDLHHEAFTFIVGQAVAAATGTTPILATPAKAHIWSGQQSFALAYDDTSVVLNLPIEPGVLIDITVFAKPNQAGAVGRARAGTGVAPGIASWNDRESRRWLRKKSKSFASTVSNACRNDGSPRKCARTVGPVRSIIPHSLQFTTRSTHQGSTNHTLGATLAPKYWGDTMAIAEGSAVPDVSGTIWKDGPAPTSLSDLFAGKKSVLFGVPGAFTPTCSNDHLPSFVNDKAALEAKGIDQVVCMATNDIFVMEAWNKANGGPNVTMLADGNGDITRALDLGLDASGFGLGFRCARFAAYIEDGTIKALNQEENPGSCELTTAKGILDRI